MTALKLFYVSPKWVVKHWFCLFCISVSLGFCCQHKILGIQKPLIRLSTYKHWAVDQARRISGKLHTGSFCMEDSVYHCSCCMHNRSMKMVLKVPYRILYHSGHFYQPLKSRRIPSLALCLTSLGRRGNRWGYLLLITTCWWGLYPDPSETGARLVMYGLRKTSLRELSLTQLWNGPLFPALM